jgi:hypothetical protein
MANQKISALAEAGTATGTDQMPLVQAGETKRVSVDTLFSPDNAAWQGWTMNTAPLTSTSWDGDAYSTKAKTLIDLSVVFGVPAGIKAILVRLAARDSGSAAGTPYLYLAPNNSAGVVALGVKLGGAPNDVWWDEYGICPCDANGDVYYECAATGAGTLDLLIQIWGYLR